MNTLVGLLALSCPIEKPPQSADGMEALKRECEAVLAEIYAECWADPDGPLVPLPKRDHLPSAERVVPPLPARALNITAWDRW